MARPSDLDLKDYWRILLRRRWWVIGSLAVAAALGVALNTFTAPIYRATSRIQVSREPTRSLLTGEMIENPTAQSDNLALYTAAELITNRRLLARVVGTLRAQQVMTGGEEPAGWFGFLRRSEPPPAVAQLGATTPDVVLQGASREELNRQIDWLLSRISVEPVRDTRLVNIHVEDSSPARAERVANAVADLFVSFHAEQRNAGSANMVAYLSGQLDEARKSLQQAERTSEYARVRGQRIEVEQRLARLNAAAATQDLDQLPSRSASLDALKKQLNDSETELAKARQIYRDRHPKLVQLESENQSIRASIRSEIQQSAAAVRAEYGAMLAREQALAGAAGGSGDVENARELYNTLLTKLKEAEMTGQARGPLVEVVEPAAASPDPVRPRKVLNLVVCLFAGLIVGTGLAFLREYLRRTIRTPQDVDDYLQLPVLGLIPKA